VSVDTLLKKSGSASPRRVFRKMLRDMIVADHLPDYAMTEEEGDLIRFSLRDGVVDTPPPVISSAALEQGRALMPGADIYALEAEWRGVWAATGKRRLRSPDGAFLGWVRKRATDRG